jgi:Domain of unknown function (DUF4145)
MIEVKDIYLETQSLDFRCPWCEKGQLTIERKEAKFGKDPDSIRAIKSEPCYPHDFGPVSIQLVCSYNHCSASTFAVGDYYYEEYDREEAGHMRPVHVLTFVPKFFYPTVQLFEIPKGLPDIIRTEALRVFKLFWVDYTSCGNAVRILIERLMDEQTIQKTRSSRAGKRVRLTLHERIEIFEAKKSKYKDLLMSLKWIGNAASHKSEITKENVLHSLDVIEFVLMDIYENRHAKMLATAKTIVKSKKPV